MGLNGVSLIAESIKGSWVVSLGLESSPPDGGEGSPRGEDSTSTINLISRFNGIVSE